MGFLGAGISVSGGGTWTYTCFWTTGATGAPYDVDGPEG